LRKDLGGSIEMYDYEYMIQDIIGDKYQHERRLIAALKRVRKLTENNSISFYDSTGALVSPRVQWNKIILPPKRSLNKAVEVDEQETELRKWQRMAEKRVKESKPIREFQSNEIEPCLHGAISGALEEAQSVDDVKRVFEGVFDWRGYP